MLDSISATMFERMETRDFHATKEFRLIKPYLSEGSLKKLRLYQDHAEPQPIRNKEGKITSALYNLGSGADTTSHYYKDAMESMFSDINKMRVKWKLI